MQKKLYKSANDKMLTGVLGGIAEYLKMDSTVVRLIFALITIITGVFPLALFYIICAIIMPEPPFTVE
ncbi:MAG: PspC domain-containing protein [Clostridia bacterium]|nr:PspC domain-containing protein [Clostridia bacterium]